MKTAVLNPVAVKNIKAGDPLLTVEDFKNLPSFSEGELYTLLDTKSRFVAQAYLAHQNKGIGWVYSLKETVEWGKPFFLEKLQQAKEQRLDLSSTDLTTAYRLVNGEGDALPGLTVDRYGDYAVFSWYSEGIYRYQSELMTAFRQVYPEVKGIYEKFRYDRKDQLQTRLAAGEEAPSPLIVKENGIRYATYLNEGLMTGIFLDQREVRAALMEKYAAGRNVLNTFSYTGAFSVAAAMGGASRTTSVDAANRARAKTVEQFEVNGLDAAEQQIYIMDVFDYVRYALRQGLLFDITVVDPPSFARSKKRTFSITKDYGHLIEELIRITAPSGILIISSNAANYKKAHLQKDISRAFEQQETAFEWLEEFHLPADFKVPKGKNSSDYLNVFVVRKLN